MTKTKKETPPPEGALQVCDGCFNAYRATEPACPACGKAARAEGGGFLEGAEDDPVLRGVEAAEAKRRKEDRQGLTGELALLEFRSLVREVVAEFPRLEWLPMLRKAAAEKELRLRDSEILRLTYQARQAQRGRLGPVLPGQPLDLTAAPWAWEGIVLAGCPNLWIGGPKVGKSSLWTSWIAAWSKGERNFLGHELVGPCPPVALAWTDQPERDSARMLSAVGLLQPDGSLAPPLTALWTAGRPLHLDPEGIEELAQWAEKHPGGLLILDSFAAACRVLALEEASGEFAAPFIELAEALEPFGVTLVAIHHSSKGRASEGPAMASRGSTALPAAASQIVSIARVSPQNPGDRRLMLQAEGRGGPAVYLLIERQGADWACHGRGDAVMAAQRRDQARERLTERQQAALDLVERRWRDGAGETTAADLIGDAAGCDLEGQNAARMARGVLSSLARKELVQIRRVGNGVSARPAGVPDGPPSTSCPPDPDCPQISLSDSSGDDGDRGDSVSEGDNGEFDRLQLEADQLLLGGMG
jgi:hypothetical protein